MNEMNATSNSLAINLYRSKIYKLALILVPILCSLASITYLVEKCFGLLNDVSWLTLILFTITNIIYLVLGSLFAKIGTDKEGKIIISRFKLAKIFLIIATVIQYNFIYYMIPSNAFWGFIFLFALYGAFFIDPTMSITSMILLLISTAIAWTLEPERLLPVHDEHFYLNLINTILAIILTFSLLATLIILIRKYLVIMKSKESMEKENKITEQLGQEKDARAIAELANKEKTNFLNNLSHEIRTPVNVLLGMSEMLQKNINNNTLNDNTLKEYANNISVAGNSLLSLINEIINFSKIESGKEILENVDYKLDHLVNEVYDKVVVLANKKELDVSINIDESIPKVLIGDAEKLKAILFNIINNAITYTKQGNVKIKIKLISKDDDNNSVKLRFSVEDTGIGIRKEDIEKIFANVGENTIESSGLGLSITQAYLNMMGARLSVDSTYGKGSEFYFDVVQSISENSNLLRQSEQTKVHKQKFITHNAKILLVDDVEMNIKISMTILEKLELNMDTAFSGQEAIEKCKLNDYDMIFMDNMMPEMDGLTATKEIRKISCYYENVPIIGLTASNQINSKSQLTSEGFNDCLTKPVSKISYEDSIRKWLSKEKIEEIDEVENYSGEEELLPLPDIDEIDHEVAINILGSEKAFLEALNMFEQSCDERLIMLQNSVITLNMNDFILQTHSLKGLTRTIGATNIADNCEFLEVKCEELTSYELKMRTGELIDRIMKLNKDISRVLSYANEINYEEEDSLGDINSLELKLILQTALQYVDSFNIENLEETIYNLKRYNLNEYADRAKELETYIKNIDYARCKDCINDWINFINNK